MQLSYEFIRENFAQMRRDGKGRHRDIASNLAISEGELIAAHVGFSKIEESTRLAHATRLRNDWGKIIASLEAIGEVMALTRNPSCVHEKFGVYKKTSRHASMGLVLGEEIDLRLFYQHWSHGFAFTEQTTKGNQRSLQFFDAQGVAIHKVFITPQSDISAFNALVAEYATEAQSEGIELLPLAATPSEKPDVAIDSEGLRLSWSALQDTHDFFGLLKKFEVSRTQALRLASPEFASKVEPGFCKKLLLAASQTGVPIMVFVGNPGMIQIHSGSIKKFVVMDTWINVLDPRFNLHLREDTIESSWIVKKPTIDGIVTSLELFDRQGETIAMFFGARKPGIPEQGAWRELVENVIRGNIPCAA